MALYLMSIYGSPAQESWFRSAWAKTGKKLDMGKSCIRFRKIEDLPLDVIGEAMRRVPVVNYIAYYEQNIRNAGKQKAAANAAGTTAKPSAKKSSSSVAKGAAKKSANKSGRKSATKSARSSAKKSTRKTAGAKPARKSMSKAPAKETSRSGR